MQRHFAEPYVLGTIELLIGGPMGAFGLRFFPQLLRHTPRTTWTITWHSPP